MTSPTFEPGAGGLRWAQAAFVVGAAYVAVSVYWGLGGTWLLETVGSSLVHRGRSASAVVLIGVWGAAFLKLIGAVLPLASRQPTSPSWHRVLRLLTVAEAAILTLYGLVWTAVGLGIQIGIVHVSSSADHRAQAWHAYLWDPWFLVWGLFVTLALWGSRHHRNKTPSPADPTTFHLSGPTRAGCSKPFRQVCSLPGNTPENVSAVRGTSPNQRRFPIDSHRAP
jgi:Protein of unknown function (DUF3995)